MWRTFTRSPFEQGATALAGLGFGKVTFAGARVGLWAEVAAQIVTDVLSVKASDICQDKNLGPNSPKASSCIVLFARRVRGKLGGLAKRHHCGWNHRGGQFGSVLADTKSLVTLGTIGAISCDDTLDSCDGGCNETSAVGNVADGRRIVNRVGVDIRNVTGVCQICVGR